MRGSLTMKIRLILIQAKGSKLPHFIMYSSFCSINIDRTSFYSAPPPLNWMPVCCMVSSGMKFTEYTFVYLGGG